MHQFVRLFVSCLLLVALAAPAYAADTFKVGAVFSATGPASFLGQPEKNTLEMAVELINESGGILGKQVEAVIYDDETDVNKCVLAVQKLLRKDQVSVVVGPTVSGNTLAVMTLAGQAKVPMVSCAAAEKIVKPVNPWVFKTPQSDRLAVQRILTHAKAAGYKKLAILTVSNGFGQAGRQVLTELVPAEGFELIADEVYGPKDTDMTAQLTKLKGLGPDAIICWGTNPGPAVVARNRVQLGITTPLYMSHGVASKKFIELAGEASEGILLPAGRLSVVEQLAADHPQKEVLSHYIAEYEKRFDTPVSTFGGYAWDAIMLVKAAAEAVGSLEPQAIRDGLEQISGFVGTSGVYTFSAEDHNGLDMTAFEMVVIENGGWKIVN